MSAEWIDEVKWTSEGLAPVVVQDVATDQILMVAWMNREALALTGQTGLAVFWSRSRQALWKKGETSGHTQQVMEIRMDCDNDVLMLRVQQRGGIACHTGRASCFYKQLQNERWVDVEPVLKDPTIIYK